MIVNGFKPVTAGAIRSGGYINSYDKQIGIDTKDLIADDGKCAVTVIPREITLNPHSCVHGGWTASLLDTVASGAAFSNQAGSLNDEEYGLTSELKLRYNAPLFAGQKYTCEGTVIKREGNNIYTEAIVSDNEGHPVATATALVKARKLDYKAT